MTLDRPVTYYPSVESTQDEARKHLSGIHWTMDQTGGRGRYDRKWHSEPGRSLAISICLPECAEHPKPYLFGMWLAAGMAECFMLHLQWPNDLILNGKKVGGILTEVIDGVPIVGIGINCGLMEFPTDIAHRATSLANEKHGIFDSPEYVMEHVLLMLGHYLRYLPSSWEDVAKEWDNFDDTKGKIFRRYDGRMGIAEGVSEEGELLWNGDGVIEKVSVAEALWGANV